jgi:hypothetical protein
MKSIIFFAFVISISFLLRDLYDYSINKNCLSLESSKDGGILASTLIVESMCAAIPCSTNVRNGLRNYIENENNKTTARIKATCNSEGVHSSMMATCICLWIAASYGVLEMCYKVWKDYYNPKSGDTPLENVHSEQ